MLYEELYFSYQTICDKHFAVQKYGCTMTGYKHEQIPVWLSYSICYRHVSLGSDVVRLTKKSAAIFIYFFICSKSHINETNFKISSTKFYLTENTFFFLMINKETNTISMWGEWSGL